MSPPTTPYEQIAAGQGGALIDNLGGHFGLTLPEAAAAVRTMLPTLTRALQANTATRSGLSDLVRALGSGQHARTLEDPSIFGDAAIRDDGNAVLGHLLGSKRQSRALAAQASYATGIGGALLEQILPYLASILMGMLTKQGGRNIGDVLNRLPDGGGFPRLPGGGDGYDGGGGGGGGGSSDNPLGNPLGVPYEDLSREISRERGLPGGGLGGKVRDALGGALGSRSGGMMGWIIKFVVLRYGWRILRFVIGAVLGRGR